MINSTGPIYQSAYSSALSGVHNAQRDMLNAVNNITSGNLDLLPDSLQQLMVAKHAHSANLTVLATLDETERHLLDILA